MDPQEMIARREARFLSDGTYLFEDQLALKGDVTLTIVTCRGWLLEMYELKTGELYFMRGKTPVAPKGKCFGVFYPSFTVSRPCFKDANGRVVGIAGIKLLPAGITLLPIVFEMRLPLHAGPVPEILKAGRNPQSVDANPNASSLSIKARKLIVEARSDNPSIARIASRLGVTHEHLSRQFRRDYAMSPRDYLHQLRLADAPLQLAMGKPIADVSQEIGYGDLSRFYKQFRKSTRTSPGLCRKMVTPGRG